MDDRKLKILLVDDDEDDYVMTRDLLDDARGSSFELDWISDYDSALKAVLRQEHDAYLFDYRLGARTGLDLLQEMMAEVGSRVPVILLTGQGDLETDLEAMKAGASDYLIKGEINAHLLERSIRYAIERKKAEERMASMAYYDSLTKLPNRSLFQDRLRQVMTKNERSNILAAVLFLDIDDFKRVNDTLGHSAGDLLLKGVAERLNQTMRKSDSVSRRTEEDMFARLGGDEFTVLLSEIREFEDAAKVSARIINALSRPFVLDNHEIYITTSIGIAVFPHDGKDMDTLLKNADAAMYHAKAQGKNNYQYYKESMNAAAIKRLALEGDIRRAMERNEFMLYYQPQVDALEGRMIGVEALIRWHHPEKGMVPPSDFIPLAEQSGLIIPISEWIIETACSQSRKWRQEGLSPIPISINLTSHQFRQHNFIKTISQAIREHDLAPEDLLLEITESTLMEDTEMTVISLNVLTKLGFRLVIDDFGTGYSSLSYLKRFPLYAIKIDQSFVRDVTTDQDDEAIARAVISMARSLKLKVVAEGVETVEQMRFLIEQGCEKMQGYLFSRPEPPDRISEFLAKQDREGAVWGDLAASSEVKVVGGRE
jgi:diguanylate cyclase (GGDEF)-like protein